LNECIVCKGSAFVITPDHRRDDIWWYTDDDGNGMYDCPCHHKTICPRCHYQHREECTKSCVRDPKIVEGVTCSYWKYKTSDGYAHEVRVF
jgi:hypothetical protein